MLGTFTYMVKIIFGGSIMDIIFVTLVLLAILCFFGGIGLGINSITGKRYDIACAVIIFGCFIGGVLAALAIVIYIYYL